MMRWVLLIGTCSVALAFGLTGLRAQVVAPVTPGITLEESWSRTYRDTFRLEKSFSDKFPGTSDEALTAFRTELAAAGVPLSNSLKLELSPDKTVLRVEFTENDRNVVERNLPQVIARAGWWRDITEARKEAIDRVLTQFRDELDAQSKSVERAARDMAQAREVGHIVDTDPEDSRGSVSVSNPELLELEKAVRKKTLVVTELQEKLERIRLMRPEELKVAFRMLNIADSMVEGLQVRLEEALAQDALLKFAGVGDNDPRRQTYRAQVDSVVKSFSGSLTSVRQSQEALLEVERRTLEHLEKKLGEERGKREGDKNSIIGYAVAKARYLNERKIYEAARLRFSAEKIDLRIKQITPSAR